MNAFEYVFFYIFFGFFPVHQTISGGKKNAHNKIISIRKEIKMQILVAKPKLDDHR